MTNWGEYEVGDSRAMEWLSGFNCMYCNGPLLTGQRIKAMRVDDIDDKPCGIVFHQACADPDIALPSFTAALEAAARILRADDEPT